MLKLTCKIRATGVNILVVYIYAHVVALNFLLLWTKQILVISVLQLCVNIFTILFKFPGIFNGTLTLRQSSDNIFQPNQPPWHTEKSPREPFL